jgi:hypothetical protein
MSWHSLIVENAATAAVGIVIVAVSFNRLLGMLWPFALVMPLIPIFSMAYSGYPSGVHLWSYVPICIAIYVRRRLGTFPR